MVSELTRTEVLGKTPWKVKEGVGHEGGERDWGAKEIAEHLQTEYIYGPDFFRKADEVVKEMIEAEDKNPRGGMRVGDVSTFGENGIVYALIYAPMTQGGSVVTEVVKGTTAMVMIRDQELADKLSQYQTLEDKSSALRQALGLITQEIGEGKARAVSRFTGWGGTPQSGLNTDALLIEASAQEERPIKMVVQPAFMGSNHTLRTEKNLGEKRRVRKGITLNDFTDQVDDFFTQCARWLGTEASPFDTYDGHSMGGAIATRWAASESPIVRAIKAAGGRIYADKPVVIGTNEQGISEWMREITKKPEYQKHVLLMSDWMSGLVRLGASDYWQEYGLSQVREAVLELGSKTPILPKVFRHYMNPGVISSLRTCITTCTTRSFIVFVMSYSIRLDRY